MSHFPTSATGLYYDSRPTGPAAGGSTVATSASANTKGSYVEFFSSTTAATNYLVLNPTSQNSLTVLRGVLWDVATGAAASEVVVIPNISHESNFSGGNITFGRYGPFPIDIATGTRVSLRSQASVGSVSPVANLHIWSAGDTDGATGYATYGVSTATSFGTSVDAGGTINTKGSWAELSASISATAQFMVVEATTINSEPGSDGDMRWVADVGVGAAASETVLVPDMSYGIGNSGIAGPESLTPRGREMLTYIAASTRVAMRTSCNRDNAVDRVMKFGITMGTGTTDTYYPQSTSGLNYSASPAGPVASGTSLAIPTLNNTKGGYTTIVASSSFECNNLDFQQPTLDDDGPDRILYDIASGAAAAEVVIVPNLLCDVVSSTGVGQPARFGTIPLTVASGTRLAMRYQVNPGASGLQASSARLLLMATGSVSGPTAYTTYGATTATTSGAVIDPGGTVDTKGSYTQVTASTTSDIQSLVLSTCWPIANILALTSKWKYDIATGAAASEVILIPDYVVSAVDANQEMWQERTAPFVTFIASGTRLAARCSCTNNDASDRISHLVILGTGTPVETAPTNHGFHAAANASNPLSIYYTSNGNPLYVLLSWHVSSGGIDNDDAITSITFNGDSLTRGGHQAVQGNTMEWWRLDTPDTGTFNVAITPNKTIRLTAGVISRTGWPASLSDHHFAAAGNLESVRQPTVQVSSGTAAEVLDWIGFNDPLTDVAATAGQAVQWNEEGTGTGSGAGAAQVSAGGLKTGVSAPSTTLTWSMINTPGEWWGHAAISYGATTLQKVTQLVLEVLCDEDYETNGASAPIEDPLIVGACTGGGTVASGSNPSDGTSLATATTPLAWVELTTGGTTYRWACTAINAATRKEPRVISIGRLTRALTDADGNFETASLTVRLSDYDRVLRGLMDTGTLMNQPIDVYVADKAVAEGAGTAQRVFRGKIRNYKPERGRDGLEFSLSAEDALTLATSAFADEVKVPRVLIEESLADTNLEASYWHKPVPVAYGSLSDGLDDDEGTLECRYVSSFTFPGADGNHHVFLVTLGAVEKVRNVYVADLASGDPPTTRAAIPASAVGSWIWAPHLSGWFYSDDYWDVSNKRYTVVVGRSGHAAIELAKSGQIPMVVDICAIESVGDGTGNAITSPAKQLLHFLNNHVVQLADNEDWLTIADIEGGGYSIFDTTTFDAVHTICAALGYVSAGVIGHGLQQVRLRDLIGSFCRSFGFDLGVNHHGQIMLTMLDRGDPASSAPVFTDQNDIIGSLDIDPRTDEFENAIKYVYKRAYRKALNDTTPEEGARLPKDTSIADWLSGLQTVTDSASVTAISETRESDLLELDWVRSDDVAATVANERLLVRRRPRPDVTFTVTISRGLDLELGDIVKVTHFEGVGASGWTERRLQVRRLVIDLDKFTVSVTARDVHDLLPTTASAATESAGVRVSEVAAIAYQSLATESAAVQVSEVAVLVITTP